MSVTMFHPTVAMSTTARPLRFGAESGSGEHTVQWQLKRNCSATPRQVMGFYASLSAVSALIGAFFWAQGATLVMPYASLEIIVVGLALLVHPRPATDNERNSLRPGHLTVECTNGRHVERAEFTPSWVRVEPEHGDRSLIELSGQGQRIAVGRFVRPEQRRQLAEELRWTLRRLPWAPAQAPVASAPESQDKSET